MVVAGAGSAALTETRLVDVRYVGQGHELPMNLPNRALKADDLPDLRRRFEDRYRQIYGLHLPDMAVEIVTWSVTVSTVPEPAERIPSARRSATAAPVGRRPVYEPAKGELVEMPIYRRSDLKPGVGIDGPAVIVEDETTTIVPASFEATVNPRGDIVMEARHAR